MLEEIITYFTFFFNFRSSGREAGGENRKCSFTCGPCVSSLTCTTAGLDLAEDGSQEFSPGPLCTWQNPKDLNLCLLPPIVCICGENGNESRARAETWCLDMGC